MPDWLALLIGGLTAITMVLTLLGLAVRYVLLPWLEAHLVKPMRQVEKQVSENHHSNDSPTVLDRFDDLSNEVRALASVIEGHIEAADDEMKRVWRAFAHILLQIKP